MTNLEAAKFLNSRTPNEVREAATHYFDVAGVDWDGKNLKILRNGEWFTHSEALNVGLARQMVKGPNCIWVQ